ncbi:MAG TPA: hypothetical protein VFS21_36800 [Roseiflexaceae bacterium]|nr:hypothetical protein [Roseiflexaceae bacterium]
MSTYADDQRIVQALAQRYQLSEAAVGTLLAAIRQGNGTAAQFNHPELGGMGQWMATGAVMIGDFSNQRLKTTVGQLCDEIAGYLRSQPASAALKPGWAATTPAAWWPAELGAPWESGSQNDMHYAYFPQPRRLLVRVGKRVTVYDTADYQIHTAAQQQSVKQTLTFHTQQGEITPEQLAVLESYEL